jgi:DNA polymerase-1
MIEKNKVIILDNSLLIHQGNAGNRRVCKCATQDAKGKVIHFSEECIYNCEKGWNYLQNKTGFRTGGLYKIYSLSVEFLRNNYEVVHVFDVPKAELSNTSILESYKGNRGEKSEAVTEQLSYAMKFFPMFNKLKCYIGITDEGDDVMARLALEYNEKDYDVLVATDDKDLYPILHYGVNLLRQGSIFRHADFVNKFGFTPDRFDEYLAITGDTADNFNLIKGLGPVAATKLLETHDHICDIFKDEYWAKLPEKYQKKLLKFCDKSEQYIKMEDELRLSYQLAQLNLKAEYRQIKNEVSLAEINEQIDFLEFSQLRNNLHLFIGEE